MRHGSCSSGEACSAATHSNRPEVAGGLRCESAARIAIDVATCAASSTTSCEHLAEFARWYTRIPAGKRLVLQSNDYFACEQHVNCVPDLAAFRAQAPMRDVLFAGERKMRRYVRFMLMGRK